MDPAFAASPAHLRLSGIELRGVAGVRLRDDRKQTIKLQRYAALDELCAVTTWREFFQQHLPAPELGQGPPRGAYSDEEVTLELMHAVDQICSSAWPLEELAPEVVESLLAVREHNPVGYAWARREILAMFPVTNPGLRRSSVRQPAVRMGER